MVMISSIEEVAQVVLQVHHQHRLRGWTLSAELGDSLLLGGGAAPLLRLDGRTHRDGRALAKRGDGAKPDTAAGVSRARMAAYGFT